ncbi:MAG TPA: choice-of-anchor tandem repeat GloVer-containing protein [Terriglobales bacterium]|nr:choice-of-anchor tandem repeat GloVer-containing protein [Terriglobales bacterium]
MKGKNYRSWNRFSRLATLATVVSVITLLPLHSATAQTFQVIHNFTNGGDGGVPPYTLAKDATGHFYGTANSGGANGDGIVFKLIQFNSQWVLTPVYNFTDQDGQPGWGVTLGPDGTIYTNASYASVLGGPCGSALRLQPSPTRPASVFTTWNETLLRTYVKREDGCPTGNLLVDSAGNVYGVTQSGGPNGWGTVFELMHTSSGWTETILYSFQGGNDGGAPYSGLIFDNAGNLYGTATARGAFGQGVVFKLTNTGSGWTESVLYAFQGGNDGGQPTAGLIFDNAGNLYGAAESFGSGGGGTVFKLSPSGGGWNYSVLTSLSGTGGPVASLTLDASGKLYGTTFFDGPAGYGSVFKLTPSGGTWTYTDLHDFTGGADGGYPGGGVTLDAAGNLYGTAVVGGADGFGVVWEITQ